MLHASRNVAVWLLGLAILGCSRPPPSAPNDRLDHLVGFALPSDDGALVAVPIAGATATVLDFFSPTCVPCKESVPSLNSKRAELAAKGARLVLIGVLADSESTEDARRALNSWSVNAPFLVDKDGTGKREAGVTALPATLVLDAKGNLKWVAPVGATVDDVLGALP